MYTIRAVHLPWQAKLSEPATNKDGTVFAPVGADIQTPNLFP